MGQGVPGARLGHVHGRSGGHGSRYGLKWGVAALFHTKQVSIRFKNAGADPAANQAAGNAYLFNCDDKRR